MEMEAFEEGVVAEIRVKEGETVPVGTVIAVLNGGAPKGMKEEKEAKASESSGVETEEKTPEAAAEKEKKNVSEGFGEEKRKFIQEDDSSERRENKRFAISPAARKLAEERQIPSFRGERDGAGRAHRSGGR